LLRQALFRLSQQPRLRALATRNSFAQSMARRFVAGETLEEAIEVVRRLNAAGMAASLDHLGENVTSRGEARDATEMGCRIFRAAADSGVRCNASFKLTQLGLDIDETLAAENLQQIVEEAARHDNFVRIDMESSVYVERTFRLFEGVYGGHKNVGVVLQSALYRSAPDLEHMIKVGARVRLCKGAYLESATVAFQRKEDVDENYVRLARMLLSGGNYPAFATHDVKMIDAVREYARQRSIAPAQYEFQMLYGVRRDLQMQLVAQGYNMRVYVPFGTHWYPYLMRRMAERPANVMFILGSVAREARSGG